MKIVYGDIWEYPADVVCITTNGSIKRNGQAVMGRGVAAQAKERYPELPRSLGYDLSQRGIRCFIVRPGLIVFPVKFCWTEKASLRLIRKSTQELALLANDNLDKVVVLPRPGCGNGGLSWAEVEPVIAPLLPDNVHVITKKGGQP